jgi:uncharacterized membrane protein YccC
MGPFAHINWRAVNAVFSGAMWLVVLILVFIILAHAVPAGAHAHPPNRFVR